MFFSKENIQEVWDHMVSKLISSQGTILSLYVASRVLCYLTKSPNRDYLYRGENLLRTTYEHFLSLISYKARYLY